MILLVIPFWKENAAQAEVLIDWIYQLAGREAYGSALLVAADDVHPENREKIKVSAELAFEHFEMIKLDRLEGVKTEQVNFAFRNVANYIQRNYKSPFFWLEPDTVPVKPTWRQQIERAYDSQPRRYCGSLMQDLEKKLFAARAICYPHDAILDLTGFCNGSVSTFNVQAGESFASRVGKHRLIQEMSVNSLEDCSKLNPNAVALHGDKSHILLRKLKGEQK